MALVPQPARTTTRKANNLVKEALGAMDRFFAEEDQTDPPLDSGYQSSRRANILGEASKACERLLWLLGHFSIIVPSALDDAAMEVLDPEILNIDDGT